MLNKSILQPYLKITFVQEKEIGVFKNITSCSLKFYHLKNVSLLIYIVNVTTFDTT